MSKSNLRPPSAPLSDDPGHVLAARADADAMPHAKPPLAWWRRWRQGLGWSLGRPHITFDASAHCVDVSASFCRLLSCERSMLVGRPVREVFGLRGGEMVLPFHQMVRGVGDEGYHCEWAQGFREGRGQDQVLDLLARPLSDGRWRVWVRELGPASGREQLALLSEAVLRQTPMGVLVTDAKRRITAINPAFARMCGHAEAHLLGRDVRQVLRRASPSLALPPRQLSVHADGCAEAPDSGLVADALPGWRGEVRVRHAMGHVLDCWQSAHVLPDWLGRPRHHVLMLQDIGSLKQQQAALLRLAYHDALTGLPNRRLFVNDLSRSLERARRHGQGVALLFLDLDRFKAVNDQLGHAQGDRLLCEVSSRIRALLRAEDSVGRWGGDEFVVALQDLASKGDAQLMATRIIQSLSSPLSLNGHEAVLSVSVGIALFPEHGQSAEALIDAADAAMYLAKRRSKGQVVPLSEPAWYGLARPAARDDEAPQARGPMT